MSAAAEPQPPPAEESPAAGLGAFAIRHRISILFVTVAICLGGIYCAMEMPSSVFPETDFPRCVVLIDNGVMPADEMMATITRPIEEAVKDIPGVVQVRSATGRGSAEVNVFFDWKTDMVQSELYVLSRLSQQKSELPPTAKTTVWRLTFNAFPILGVSLTSPTRSPSQLWEMARYELKPRFLRIPGVGRVDLVGGRQPEYHVVLDPMKLAAAHLAISDVSRALAQENVIAPAGFYTDNYTLYLTLVDGRAATADELAEMVVATRGDYQVRVRDVAHVERGPEPVFNVVTAQGRPAVLLNVRAQPHGSNILNIASALKRELASVRREGPSDVQLSFFYDQSLFVQDSIGSVWDAILIGLLFAVVILFAFLRNWGSVLTAIVVIPVSVLATVVIMFASEMTFNLMTLGGIAAAIGLIIDDAIVVVEAIFVRTAAGEARHHAIVAALREILHPLIGSTFTPVVVFIPLGFLDGLPGVFFRALAMTMVVSLLTSLVLAVTLTPALASVVVRARKRAPAGDSVLAARSEADLIALPPSRFEKLLLSALRRFWLTLPLAAAVLVAGALLYGRLETDFMPEMDEGGFVIDYHTPFGTSLEETDRVLRQAEAILQDTPEVEGFSRRTGARLALAIAEPNTGDFLVKLRPDRRRSTDAVKSELRRRFNRELPEAEWEFPGILSDLVGDLTWSPKPIEVKLFSTDIDWLKKVAPLVEQTIAAIPGVVDTFDGLVETGPTLTLRVRRTQARRFGLTARDIGDAVDTAMLGRTRTTVLEGDRVLSVRVRVQRRDVDDIARLLALPLRTPAGELVTLGQVTDVTRVEGQLELHREDLRQLVAVTGDLEGRDTGSAIAAIKTRLSKTMALPPAAVEFGGLFEQQVTAFHNLMVVLALGTTLVFTVLLFEFRSFVEPIAIVVGALSALFGTLLALWLTGTSLNIVSFLGAIIGVGIVAKNGILMLDLVGHLRARGLDAAHALARSARRRFRPILMTTLSTILAMLPTAWGIGHGADMLRPLAIAIIGALCTSMFFSLLVTPTVHYVLGRYFAGRGQDTPMTER